MFVHGGKLVLVFVAALFLCTTATAQLTIKGRVTDTANVPLAFASLILLKDSAFFTATTTGEDGSFEASSSFEKGKKYLLQISLAGYQPVSRVFVYPDTAFLRHLILAEDGKRLHEVKVTTKNPLIWRKVDRYVVNVENSFLADGNSALDVLQKSPGVWVDSKGGIRIKGTGQVMVMINDVMQQLSGEELADYLRSLRSEDVSRVEIIHNPPAEFEAAGSGGIIHIILKKGKKNGWTASVTAQYRRQGSRPYTTAGGAISYGLKKLTLSGTYSLTKDVRYIFEKAAITYGGYKYINATDRNETIRRRQYRAGIVYDLSADQSVSLQTSVSQNRFRQSFITGEEFSDSSGVITGTTRAGKLRNFSLHSTTLNYTWKMDTAGANIRLIADYTDNHKPETNDFDKVSSDPAQSVRSRNNAPTGTELYTVQCDYTKPFHAKSIVNAGVKYASIKRDNTLATENYTINSWQINAFKTSHFIYSERGMMLYASLETSVKKTAVKAGIRGEQTFSKGSALTLNQFFSKKYFGLFPSLFLVQTINEKKGTAATLSYSRRLTRPSLSDLNPARLEYNGYTAITGNPDLLPQYANNLTLGYRFKNYETEVYLTKTINYIALSASRGSNNFIEYLSANTGSTLEYGISFTGTITLLQGWTVSNNLALYRSSYYYNGLPYRQTTLYANSVHTIVLKNIVDIDAVADYRSPYVYTNLHTAGTFSLDLGFTRRLFNSRGRLRLGLTDLFNTLKEKELTTDNDTRIEFYRKRPTRMAALSFTYNFSGGKKISSRKIDQGNGEERGRIGN